MKADTLQQTLTFCKRIGKLSLGFDAVKADIQLGKACLVLFATDLSPKTRNQIEYLCQECAVPSASLPYTMDECWYLIGKRVGILAVQEEAFAQKLASLIQNSEKEGGCLYGD